MVYRPISHAGPHGGSVSPWATLEASKPPEALGMLVAIKKWRDAWACSRSAMRVWGRQCRLARHGALPQGPA